MDIVESIEVNGDVVHIVNGLSPMGDFAQNGETALQDLGTWYEASFPDHDVPITILGHCAGGFYSLYLAAHAQDLPIRKIVLFSTPMLGSELADFVFGHLPLLDSLFMKTGSIFDLRGLAELTTTKINTFLEKLDITPQIQIYAVSGKQSRAQAIYRQFDAEYLSPLFSLTAALIGGESDGMVSRRSALATRAGTLTGQFHPMPEISIPLDHAEQVLDYRLLALFGTRHATWVSDQQRAIYPVLAKIGDR
ncbi:MAG: hypothetical protein AABZ06_05090 [Bdellovibrionota bacterium]